MFTLRIQKQKNSQYNIMKYVKHYVIQQYTVFNNLILKKL